MLIMVISEYIQVSANDCKMICLENAINHSNISEETVIRQKLGKLYAKSLKGCRHQTRHEC